MKTIFKQVLLLQIENYENKGENCYDSIKNFISKS
jgi:hypothetical protein